MIEIPLNRKTDRGFSVSGYARAGVRTFCIVCLVAALSCSRSPAYPEAPRMGQEIVVDVSAFPQDTPKFFTYHYKGKNINYFIVRSGDNILAFFDACASCYVHRKGYGFDKGYFVCRYCNVRYSISDLERGIGGCFPIRVSGDRRNGKYFISVSTLEAAADKF